MGFYYGSPLAPDALSIPWRCQNKSAKSVEIRAIAIVAAQVSYAMPRACGAFTLRVEYVGIKRISFIYFMWCWPVRPSQVTRALQLQAAISLAARSQTHQSEALPHRHKRK